MAPEPPPPDGGISDERLMMFADGTLDDAEAAAVARALAADPALETRLAAFLATRHGLKGAYARVMNERPPERLIAAILDAPPAEAGTVVAFETRRPARENIARKPAAWLPLAMAAGIGAFALGLGGYLVGQNSVAPGSALLALAGGQTLQTLSSLKDGDRADFGAGLVGAVSGSYRMADRRFCRTLLVEQAASATAAEGVACLGPQGWQLVLALPRLPAGQAYRPAAGAGPIDALLEAGGAQAALSPREVEALIGRGWRAD